MLTRRIVLAVCASVVFGLSAGTTSAAESQTTTISIQGMHCAGCAAKISRQLQAIEGVATAQADATQANAIVTPKTNATPSPRALWEAVEKAGYKPTKIVGPSGMFTEKPKT